MSHTSFSYEPGPLLHIRDLKSFETIITCVAFSPSGALICAGFANRLRFWDISKPMLHILDYTCWQGMDVTCITWDHVGLHCGFSNGAYCTIFLDEETWVSVSISCNSDSTQYYTRISAPMGTGWGLHQLTILPMILPKADLL